MLLMFKYALSVSGSEKVAILCLSLLLHLKSRSSHPYRQKAYAAIV